MKSRVILAKERKRSSQGSLAPKKKSRKKSADLLNFSLDDVLTNDLLIEVLLRLPASKSAICSMLVSKRWHSLISTRSFISHFISHHIDHEISKNSTDCYAASYQFRPDIFMSVWGDPRLCPVTRSTKNSVNSFDCRSKGFRLRFLPERRKNVSIEASCNDLLLCRANEKCIYDLYTSRYYVCNPFTKQWLSLPSPAITMPTSPCYCKAFLGLVCEPNYQEWPLLGRQQQIQYQSRFRVVFFAPSNESDSVIHVYCSETGLWNQSHVSTPQYRCHYGNIVAHDGKLHWYNGKDVVAYDPFNKGRTIFLELNPSHNTGNLRYVSFCLRVCQGSLRIIKTICNFHCPAATDHVSVWELKDYESRSLILVRKVFFNSMSAQDPPSKYILSHYCKLEAIALHPDNKDLAYLKYRGVFWSPATSRHDSWNTSARLTTKIKA